MNKIFFLCWILILVSAAHAETKIYKHVDENGNVYYSDQKPSEDAKEADLPKLTIVESKDYQSNEPRRNNEASTNTREDPAPIKTFKMRSPQPEETIVNTGGELNASVSIDGELPPSLAIRFFLDGNAQKTVNSDSILIENVFRGEHEIYAQIVDLTRNKVIKTTPKVKFYMRQHIKKR